MPRFFGGTFKATATVAALCTLLPSASAMNKAELVEVLASELDGGVDHARQALNGLAAATTAALKNGDRVSLVGFGSFSISTRACPAVGPDTAAVDNVEAVVEDGSMWEVDNGGKGPRGRKGKGKGKRIDKSSPLLAGIYVVNDDTDEPVGEAEAADAAEIRIDVWVPTNRGEGGSDDGPLTIHLNWDATGEGVPPNPIDTIELADVYAAIDRFLRSRGVDVEEEAPSAVCLSVQVARAAVSIDIHADEFPVEDFLDRAATLRTVAGWAHASGCDELRNTIARQPYKGKSGSRSESSLEIRSSSGRRSRSVLDPDDDCDGFFWDAALEMHLGVRTIGGLRCNGLDNDCNGRFSPSADILPLVCGKLLGKSPETECFVRTLPMIRRLVESGVMSSDRMSCVLLTVSLTPDGRLVAVRGSGVIPEGGISDPVLGCRFWLPHRHRRQVSRVAAICDIPHCLSHDGMLLAKHHARRKETHLHRPAANRSRSIACACLALWIHTFAGFLQMSLVGFGSFSVSKRAARTGRNPQTGKEIKIAGKNVVRFKAGSEFSDKVN
eukprot:m.134689 g.134689  ORF g.134689 m.134689 type:complete len:554 (-) comp13879_c0_seq5:104-1765(-)